MSTNAESDRTDKEKRNERKIENRSAETRNKRLYEEIYNKNDIFREGSESDVDIYGEQSASNRGRNSDGVVEDSGRIERRDRDASLSEGVVVRLNQKKNTDKESAKDVHKRVLDRESGNTDTVQSSRDVVESESGLQAKIKAAIEQIKTTEELLTLDTNAFNEPNTKITEQISEYFESIGGSVFRTGFGNVVLNKKGIKSAIAHGIGRAKCIAFRAVLDVIKYGSQIDYQEAWKGRKYNTIVFAGKVKIGERDAYVGVVVKQNKDTNEYYLHEVVDENGYFIRIKNNEVAPFKTVSKTDNSLHGGTTSVDNNISQNNNIVNSDNLYKSEKYFRNIDDNSTENRWTTERVNGAKDSNVNIADIVKDIRDKFDIPISTGKVTDCEASGIYKETIIHEIQHAIHRYEGFEPGGNSNEMIEYLREKAHFYLIATDDEKLKQIIDNGTLQELDAYIDDYIKTAFKVKSVEDVAEKAYTALYGEKEANATAKCLKFNSNERVEKYPDYEKGAILRGERSKQNNNFRVFKSGIRDG